MADEAKSLINLVPQSIDNAAKNITDAPTKNMGQTMADLWFLIFGGISQAADKRRAQYNIELNKFKEELTASLDKVPEENRQEPSSHIVLSSLEEAKFCVEEEELRELFVSLLTSATDSTKTVHPSFASIIRQMSPNDAFLIREFKRIYKYPLCNIKYVDSKGYFRVLFKNLVLIGRGTEHERSVSVSSLIRLGLLETPHGEFINDPPQYAPFKRTTAYLSQLAIYPANQLQIEELKIQLTPLGRLFLECCVS